MRRSGILRGLVGAILVLVAACGGGPGSTSGSGVAYPGGCASFQLSARQCTAIVEYLAGTNGVDLSTVTAVKLLDQGPCDSDPGVTCPLTGRFLVRVRFVVAGGRAIEESWACTGVGRQYDQRCVDVPEIRLSSPTLDGYRDIPCTGDAPSGCASPLPTIDPKARARAAGLRVASVDIPVNHAGAYDILLGPAVLPNGILSDASFTLADLHPTTFGVTMDGVQLRVISRDGRGALKNLYAHGWRKGVEHVEVRVTFTVTSFQPGAVLQLRDVAVS